SPVELAKAYPTMVNTAEPSAIKAIVRIPAGFSLRCRSIPTQAPHSSARILSEMDPHGYGNNECQLSVSQCISYGNENAKGMQREELQEKGLLQCEFALGCMSLSQGSSLVDSGCSCKAGKICRISSVVGLRTR